MTYSAKYDDSEIRSTNHDVIQYMLPLLNCGMEVIDLGCGTCRKSIRIAPYVTRIDCIDINKNMLKQAVINKNKTSLSNIRLCHGDNMDVPIKSNSYDFCTAFLTTWSPAEAHRLLRNGGMLFIETLCSDDKIEMKAAFGKDEFGWRGRYLNQNPNERLCYLKKQIGSFFDIISMEKVSFNTILTYDGLVRLLLETPTIRDFSLSRDKYIIEKLTHDKKITLIERRVMIKAQLLNKEIYNDR
jgi:SAM-dependent methyltransferase